VELTIRVEGGRERPVCPGCGYVFFGEFSVGVGGVVVRDGRVLLIRRGHEPSRGWWQLPGGYAEADEVVVDAVAREVYEEAGVRARVVESLGFRHSVGGKGSIGGPSTNVYIIFRMEQMDGDGHEPACDGDEITGTGYFSPEEIAGMERVQNLTKWAIGRALSGARGFAPAQVGTDPAGPGWILFGAKGE
jgi:ADP-ribose pyrophosphatase YjhB (NUDIX family)